VTGVNGAHLGDMLQELGVGEAVLCGATVCSVVEESEECGVQLKQSSTHTHTHTHTHTPHYSIGVYTHSMGCQAFTPNQSINHASQEISLARLFRGSCLKVNCGLLQSVAKQQVKLPVPAWRKCAAPFSLHTCVTYSHALIRDNTV